MKRSLWIAIGVLALLALVGITFLPSREGFSVPATIDPRTPIPESEINAVISRLPANFEETNKAEIKAEEDAFNATATGTVNGQAVSASGASAASPPMSAEEQRQMTRMNVTATLFLFKKYLHDKGKIGDNVAVDQADIDAFIATLPTHSRESSTRMILNTTLTLGVGTANASGYAANLADLGQTAGYSAPPGSGGSATTTGTTTGGSSASSPGPNNLLPTMGGRNVFGPLFTSLGDSSAQGGDSSKTNKYPALLGPNPKPSTRIEGAGIVDPSKNYTLANDGSLPTGAHTGSDENSRFLPTSRVPGDMDVVDPYRTSQSFQASSYSFKNEPVPFLTDFSAFQR
jgi:type IV pilus biogenesis protein CpaD/CtpE